MCQKCQGKQPSYFQSNSGARSFGSQQPQGPMPRQMPSVNPQQPQGPMPRQLPQQTRDIAPPQQQPKGESKDVVCIPTSAIVDGTYVNYISPYYGYGGYPYYGYGGYGYGGYGYGGYGHHGGHGGYWRGGPQQNPQ